MAPPLLPRARESIACYPPDRDERECLETINALVAAGFSLEDLRPYAKGTDSLLLLNAPTKTLIKVPRLDSNASPLKEGLFLLLLEKSSEVKLAPRVYSFSERFVHMELIEGEELADFLDRGGRLRPSQICSLLRKALALDLIGVDHGELVRPHKHVMLTKRGGEPVFVDFGRASATRRSKNLASLLSFLVGLSDELSRVRAQIIEELRRCKVEKDRCRLLVEFLCSEVGA